MVWVNAPSVGEGLIRFRDSRLSVSSQRVPSLGFPASGFQTLGFLAKGSPAEGSLSSTLQAVVWSRAGEKEEKHFSKVIKSCVWPKSADLFVTPFQTLYYLPAGPRSVTKAGLWSCFSTVV